jgi:hypothetical protein
MKLFEDFFSDEKSKEIYGMPSGQMIEVSESEFNFLKKIKLIKFVAFSEKDLMIDDIIPIYEWFFYDKDYDKIINLLMNSL